MIIHELTIGVVVGYIIGYAAGWWSRGRANQEALTKKEKNE